MTTALRRPPASSHIGSIFHRLALLWARRRPDLAFSEALLVAAFFALSEHLRPGLWPNSALAGWLGVVFLFAGLLWPAPRAGEIKGLQRSLIELVVGTLALLVCHLAFDQPLAIARFLVLAWLVAALAVYRLALTFAADRLGRNGLENVRWLVLAAGALWLLQGFIFRGQHGASDARWYGTMLADMVAQTRAGILPVFVGQSEWQFNGAIYPLRVAPGFHYFGGLLDALTGQVLHPFTLQNLLIVVTGFITAFTTYFCLAALAPGHRTAAMALSLLFLGAPGVLGMVYNSDLYMSWMTVPFLPLALFGTVRSFRGGGVAGGLALAGGLGMMWWGHSPLALWTTLIATGAQIVRVLVRFPDARERREMAGTVALFVAIALFPIASVLFFPVEPGVDTASFQKASPENIVYFLRSVYPQVLEPVSEIGRQLGDLQLGYALWGLLAVSILFLARRRAETFVLVFAAVGLALLLTPAYGIELSVWSHVPAFVRDPTSNWAMNRLYCILAACVVFAAASAWPEAPRRRFYWGLITLPLLGAACGWTFHEAAKFHAGSVETRPEVGLAQARLLPENITITRFAHFVFGTTPAYFTHGTADPEMENRLLATDTWEPLVTNEGSALAQSPAETATASFAPFPGAETTLLELDRKVRLEAGRRYLLEVDFTAPEKTTGVLQMIGSTFYREYGLPEYGGARSFGAGGTHSHVLSVWTSSKVSEELTVRIVLPAPVPDLPALLPYARVRLRPYDPDKLPVRLTSWLPYEARVRSPGPAWLETPRRFQTGYEAHVNGRQVSAVKSPEGLVSVRVPEGESAVTLVYRAPLGLRAAFWISVAAAALTAVGALHGLTHRRSAAPFETPAGPGPFPPRARAARHALPQTERQH